MRELIERVRELVREAGISKISKLSGVKRYTVKRFIDRENITVDTFLKLIDALERMGYSFKRESIEYEPVVLSDEPIEVAVKPVYGFIGAGDSVSTDDIVDKVPVPVKYAHPRFLFCRVKGNSMEPMIMDGAVVGVDTEDKVVENGKIYVLSDGGEFNLVKKLYRHGKFIILYSVNPSYPPVMKFSGDIWVVGRVRLVINRL